MAWRRPDGVWIYHSFSSSSCSARLRESACLVPIMCLFRVDPLAITATQRSSSLVRVHQGTNGNLKLSSGMLLDNYRLAINVKKAKGAPGTLGSRFAFDGGIYASV